MSANATTPSANGNRPGRTETSNLERAIELLLECVDLLRAAINEARPSQDRG